jgi:hypothetical protein
MCEKFYKNGIRFKCQGTGKCCKSGKLDGYVYLTLEDRRQIAKHLGLSTQQFTRRYVAKNENEFHFKQLKGNCPFLEQNQCSIYNVRPLQCRTWPFWPENMKRDTWEKEVKKVCSGIGKGKLYTMHEINEILKCQKILS